MMIADRRAAWYWSRENICYPDNSSVRTLSRHCTVAGWLLLLSLGQVGHDAAAQTVAAHSFRVFVRGADAGTQEVTLFESADGWTLRGSGRLNPPLNLAIEYWEARYDRAWNPIELTVNLAEGKNQFTVHTSVDGTTAASDVAQNGQNQRRSHTIARDAIMLPNLIFGAYEALAARLATASVGAQLQAFIAPQNVVPVSVARVTDETVQVPGRTITARRWTLRFGGPSGVLEVEVWTDGTRLLRLDIPSQMLSVLREDIASVSARLVTLGRSNDEEVSIPANGFSLAATVSKPALAPNARLAAVVLVSGTTSSGRDEIIAGVPIFAQLATAIADAGFLAVRYDQRGTGQSGGRPESATFDDFATDARAVINLIARRKDVDPKRIAIIGYGDGGWISMIAAARENRVAALSLIGTPSISGTELVLEQQRQLFDRTGTTAAAQQAAVEQQKSILQAVITGKGWENLPPQIRRRVDTGLYRSFLLFDPAPALSRVRQPMLIVHADLDREVPVYHGEQLAQLARSRLRARGTEFVRLPGLNHLLTRAETGDVNEYGTLAERNVSPAAVLEITSWLRKTLAPEPPR
jgi:pimeloyl-ACP methyl ester carboxylesterase